LDGRASALRQIFDAAVASADPAAAVLQPSSKRTEKALHRGGAGKDSASMAAALNAAWPNVDLSGVVVTRYSHAVTSGRVEILEASHPVPDAMSETAARRILAAVQDLNPDDLVVALISGGGSALMTLPAGGMTFADKQAVNRALLAIGATITEMNSVRTHLSASREPPRRRRASRSPGDDPRQ
jgi:glycerate 2-kinase